MENSEARNRFLDAAEKLFVKRGYNAVTVKDIAKEIGKNHASLYHHINGGKSGLYVEVMTRHIKRHQDGIWDIINKSPDDLRTQLCGIAAWFLTHQPIDIIRMTTSDFPEIPRSDADHIGDIAHETTLVPIMHVLEAAAERGEISHSHLGNIAGAIFSSIQGIHMIPDEYVIQSKQFMAEEIIDVMIRGLQVS